MFMTKNRQLLQDLQREVAHLKDVLVVMDPKVSTSAEAYEGLRRTVVAANSHRTAHLVQLSNFSKALVHGADTTRLAEMVDEWMQQAGLVAVSEARPELYEILDGDPASGQLEVMKPAYVDPQTGALIAQGQARWLRAEANPEPIQDDTQENQQEALA